MKPLDEGGLEAVGREAALGELLLEEFGGDFGDSHGVVECWDMVKGVKTGEVSPWNHTSNI